MAAFGSESSRSYDALQTAGSDPGCSLTRGLDVKLSVMRLPGPPSGGEMPQRDLTWINVNKGHAI
jgi:hypothetical protein